MFSVELAPTKFTLTSYATHERRVIKGITATDPDLIPALALLNTGYGVLKHGMRVQVFNLALIETLAEYFVANKFPHASIKLRNTRSIAPLLHDVGKIIMGQTAALTLAYNYPERHGLASTPTTGNAADNRNFETHAAYLMHPVFGLYIINYLAAQHYLRHKANIERCRENAASHQETPRELSEIQVSYPRRYNRNPKKLDGLLLRGSDMAVGMGVERRSYRKGFVPWDIQEKIFSAIMPDNLLLRVLTELDVNTDQLPPSVFRNVMLLAINMIEEYLRSEVGVHSYVIEALPSPSKSSFPSLGTLMGIIWEANQNKFRARKGDLVYRLTSGEFNDPLRNIQ